MSDSLFNNLDDVKAEFACWENPEVTSPTHEAMRWLIAEVESLRAELAAANTQIEKYAKALTLNFHRMINDADDELDTLKAELAAARKRIEVLSQALEDYGRHEPDCDCFGDGVRHTADCANCDCGLKEVLEGA